MLLVGERGTCKAAGCVRHVTEAHHFTADVEVREICRTEVFYSTVFLLLFVCCSTLIRVVRETNSVKVVTSFCFLAACIQAPSHDEDDKHRDVSTTKFG